MIRDLIENSNRYHRAGLQEYNAMIIGIPNVGKSSFINIVRAKNLRIGKTKYSKSLNNAVLQKSHK